MGDRTDKYTLEWKAVTSGPEAFKYAVITINELWSIGHLTFKTPLRVEVFFGEKSDEPKQALAVYDFGMEERIPLELEKNWLRDYAGKNDENDPAKTVFSTIKFDLMHAFFHYSGDPNYGHTHWALFGMLKDRVDADDSFIFDDYEKSNPDNKTA